MRNVRRNISRGRGRTEADRSCRWFTPSDPPVDLEKLPFDPFEYLGHELPWDGLDAD